MSLVRSFDFQNYPHIQDLFIGWVFGAGMTYLFKRFRLSLKHIDIRNNWNWFRIIFVNVFSLIILDELTTLFGALRLKKASNFFMTLNKRNFRSGFRFFTKNYPELAYEVFKLVKNANTALKIYEITGIMPKFG